MGLSISLAGFLFAYPQKVVEIFQLKQQVEPELLVRWLVPGWLLFLGLVIAHLWYVRISSKSSQIYKLHEKVTRPIGCYYDVLDNKGNKILRITVKDITKQSMPDPHSNLTKISQKQTDMDSVTLSFDPFLTVYPGQAVKFLPIQKPISESLFALSKKIYQEELQSVFFFNTEHNEQFFRCYVDHINTAKQEVEIDVYFLQMEKV